MPTVPIGLSSFGTDVAIGLSAYGGAEVLSSNVLSANLPGQELQFFEDKSLGQADRVVTSIPTWIMPGTLTLNMKYAQAQYLALLNCQTANPPTRVYVRLTFPKALKTDGTLQTVAATADFRAYVQQPSVEFPEDAGRVPINLTLKVDSTIIFTAGS